MRPPKEGYVIGRRVDNQLAFLCERCGKVHFHGPERGHRVSHCFKESYAKFGDHYDGYFLNESEQLPGFLDEDESRNLVHLSKVAHEIVSGMDKFLDLAGIDPTSEAAAKVIQARHALADLANIDVNSLNPFEKLVNESMQHTDEEE